MNVCILLSGSIACYKTCELISRLVKAGHAVRCIMTENSMKFVGATTLEALSGNPVITDLFAARDNMAHIEIRKWTDLFLFYPATANRINAMAVGLAPDLTGAVYLANNAEKPFWIAPAMNSSMLAHPATQDALVKLQTHGATILSSGSGRLACGDTGYGRLLEPHEAFALIQTHHRSSLAAKLLPVKHRVLITGGAMTEAIDAVRAIRNSSSGRTAAAIAAQFLDQGWQVDLLHHESAILEGSEGAECQSYTGFKSFASGLEQLLKVNSYDAIVHAAAVSDYQVEQSNPDAKLESAEVQQLTLRPTPKLLSGLKSASSPQTVVVAFKLTNGQSETEGALRAAHFLQSGYADFVVWNDQKQLSGGSLNTHPFVVFAKQPGACQAVARGDSNQALGSAVFTAVEESINKRKEIHA